MSAADNITAARLYNSSGNKQQWQTKSQQQQTMAQDKVKALYDTFVKEGYSMESEAEFRKNLSDPSKRKAAYEALKNEGYDMEAYDEFETNIGYGRAQEAATPRSTATPATRGSKATPAFPAPKMDVKPYTPVAQPSSKTQGDTKATGTAAGSQRQGAPATTPSPEASQPTWSPSEQYKIRMSRGLNNMLNEFRKQSRGRMEKAKRTALHVTPEGRERLKAGKFRAQLAGTPTTVPGVTPNVRKGEVTTADPGEVETGNDGKPLESGQSPVPFGVRYVNGKAVTEWLLPDGTLTRDLVEADKAEYGARTVRLRKQFESRMKQNGLDPAKQEDVQRQAELDMISTIVSPMVEKPRVFDPFGHPGFDPAGKIILTL